MQEVILMDKLKVTVDILELGRFESQIKIDMLRIVWNTLFSYKSYIFLKRKLRNHFKKKDAILEGK